MKLFVVRHAQTNYNQLGLCNDDPTVDVHLTKEGIAQATKLKIILKNENFEKVFVSELPRTRQTAEILNQGRSTSIETDLRLNDIHNGFEGRSVEDYRHAVQASEDPWLAVFNGGESYADVYKRTKDFLDELRNQPYQAALVVTSQIIFKHMHGLLNQLTRQQIMNLDVKNLQLEVFDI